MNVHFNPWHSFSFSFKGKVFMHYLDILIFAWIWLWLFHDSKENFECTKHYHNGCLHFCYGGHSDHWWVQWVLVFIIWFSRNSHCLFILGGLVFSYGYYSTLNFDFCDLKVDLVYQITQENLNREKTEEININENKGRKIWWCVNNI